MRTARILIVDDEPHITHVVSLKLRRAGFEVATAHNGAEAMDLIPTFRPDLVITDFQMPILSGFDLARQLAADPATAGLPLLMVTARGHILSDEDLARTNIRAVMCKPFSPREVLERVERVLEAVGTRRSWGEGPSENLAA